MSPERLSAAIKGFRGVALADTTPINFCAVDLFWLADGRAVDDRLARPATAVLDRSKCEEAALSTSYVRITGLSVYADSVVVQGVTRNSQSARAEIYVFGRRDVYMPFQEYRVATFYSIR